MADVVVNCWAEFLQAIQVSGDTVICPDGAIWDMNEIEPDGHIGTISVNCDAIYGHNTTIKNLKIDGYISFHSGFQIMSDLHFENVLANTLDKVGFLFREGTFSTSSPVSSLSQMVLCRVSGFFTHTNVASTSYTTTPIRGFICYRCGINVESPCRGFTLPYKMQYTNFLAQLQNVESIYGSFLGTKPTAAFGAEFSNIVIVAPNCTYDYTTSYANGCVFRGRKERLTSFQKAAGTTNMSLYCTTDMQALVTPRGVVGVTEEQLRDANYLQNIGFPIAVD